MPPASSIFRLSRAKGASFQTFDHDFINPDRPEEFRADKGKLLVAIALCLECVEFGFPAQIAWELGLDDKRGVGDMWNGLAHLAVTGAQGCGIG